MGVIPPGLDSDSDEEEASTTTSFYVLIIRMERVQMTKRVHGCPLSVLRF